MVAVLQIVGTELLVILIGVCFATLLAVIVAALWLHGDAQSRGMAATVWIVLLILASFFGGFIGFAIVVVVYLVVRGNHPVGGAMPYGYVPYPVAPQAACPVCGGPMTWYPEYQRWYCPSCGQYR